MSWNPILSKVIEVKREWEKLFGTDEKNEAPMFSKMLEELNKKEYNDIFDCLQIRQDGNYILVRYGLHEIGRGLWDTPNSIYRECRSVVINLKTEELVLTPFRKFFNLNEVKENSLEEVMKEISKAEVVEITDKLDGSMQSARWYNDKPFMAGSMSLNPKKSWRLEEGYKMLTQNYLDLLKDYPNYTFIFEFISLKDAHVVKYSQDEEGLYLIGVRDVMTGVELSYKDIKKMSEAYNVPMAKIENTTIEQVLEDMKTLSADKKEGWILNIDGHKIKIKCDDYVNLHRLLDKLASVNTIIKNIAEDRIDDMLSKTPKSHRDRIERLITIVRDYVAETESAINYYYNKAPKNSKKCFMIWVDSNVPKEYRKYIKNKYLGRGYNILKNNKNGYKTVKEMNLREKIVEVM